MDSVLLDDSYPVNWQTSYMNVMAQQCSSNTEDTDDHHTEQNEIEQNHVRGLTFKQKICFSVGHIQNDLQAYAATSYLLLFLSKVIGLKNNSTGVIFLVAQVSDGVLSPVLGYLCDRYQFPWLARFGKRKAWHMFGVIILLIFSPFLFIKCLPCESLTSESQREQVAIVWYSIIVISIHIGFATVQISHLALLPDIAKKQGDHVKLNSLRTAWTFVSGMFVYGVFWLLLGESTGQKLSANDKQEFLILGVIIVAVGFVFTVVFYVGVNENEIRERQAMTSGSAHESANNLGYQDDGNFNQIIRQNSENKLSSDLENNISTEDPVVVPDNTRTTPTCSHTHESIPNGLTIQMTSQIPSNQNNIDDGIKVKVKRWFKTKQFYMVGTVYMCSRVVVNISNAYFPFYLEETLEFEKQAIAYFPLVVLVASAVFSWVAKKIGSYWNGYVAHCIEASMAIGAFLWLRFQPTESRKLVYGASVLMGAGSSMMLVTALTMAAVMIDSLDKTTGAFVYGFMSLTDKVANGVIVSIVQTNYPKKVNGICSRCGSYIRSAFPLVTVSAASLSLVVVIVMFVIHRKEIEQSRKHEQNGSAINHSFINPSVGSQSNHESNDAYDTKL